MNLNLQTLELPTCRATQAAAFAIGGVSGRKIFNMKEFL